MTAFVVDDTGFPKKGRHSVGVARQYSGTLGRTDNCQIATSLHLAGERGSGCIGMRLYLPETWTDVTARAVARRACPRRSPLRRNGSMRSTCSMRRWRPACATTWCWATRRSARSRRFATRSPRGDSSYVLRVPRHPRRVAARARASRCRPAGARRDARGPRRGPPRPPSPLTLAAVAATLRHRRVTWREGSRGRQASRFAAVRVHLAHRHAEGAGPGPEVWLLSEWPRDEPAPTKYYLSSLPATTPLRTLVRFGKLRWRIERDYQELKGELGLDHFEGRTWNGFHHHVALCAAAHAFLALRRALFPPALDPMDDRRRAPTSAIAAAPSAAPMSAVWSAHQRRASAPRARHECDR